MPQVRRISLTVLLLAILLAVYAFAECPHNTTCAIDDQPMIFTGISKSENGHLFWKYAHDYAGKHHEIWIRCD